MKGYLTISVLFALLLACSGSQDKNTDMKNHPDRMAMKFKDITQIADMRRLTDLKKDMDPFFSPSGDRIYFKRLLIPTPADTEDVLADAREEYFSIDHKNDKLYFLEGIPEMEEQAIVPPDSLPSIMGEKALLGFRVGKAIYFCTYKSTEPAFTKIYKVIDDSLIQLSFGSHPAFPAAISPDKHYLAFYYGEQYTRLVVIDLQTDEFYLVPRSKIESKRYDFAPDFSPDSRYLVFLRSGDLYRKGDIPFGDIWLVEFYDSTGNENR
jgi:hypothetical protein